MQHISHHTTNKTTELHHYSPAMNTFDRFGMMRFEVGNNLPETRDDWNKK